MTDETAPTPAGTQERDPSHPDWYLQMLAGTANNMQGKVELPITLYVHGLVVSGLLTSGGRYFDALGEQITAAFGPFLGEPNNMGEQLTSGAAEIYAAPRDSGPPAQYIHLRDAHVFAPGQQALPANGIWWRGRLASVDGFHFGTLAASHPST